MEGSVISIHVPFPSHIALIYMQESSDGDDIEQQGDILAFVPALSPLA